MRAAACRVTAGRRTGAPPGRRGARDAGTQTASAGNGTRTSWRTGGRLGRRTAAVPESKEGSPHAGVASNRTQETTTVARALIEAEREVEGTETVLIEGVQQFVDELRSAGDKLVVVDFFASWCHACQKVQPKVEDLCAGRHDIVLLKVPYDKNKQICKSLSVKKLPFFHFYRGSHGKLDGFSASSKTFHRIEAAVEIHGTPRCTIGPNAIPEELGELADLER